jgi:hypothetical protein
MTVASEPKGRASIEREAARRTRGTSGRARPTVDGGLSAPEANRALEEGEALS